ncbi:hypothetical protein T265_13473, partial [Opisthorchis viverrini]
MDTELVECPEEHRDYCLNGGQCYMLKSDRNVLQCRKSHLNKTKRPRPTGGRKRQSRSAQGSNLLLGSRAVSCTEFEDRSGLHVNNAVTIPVPTGRMSSNVHSVIQPPERNQIMAYGLTGVHLRDTLDPELGPLVPAGNVSYRNAWNQSATLGHKACRDFFDVSDVTYTPQCEPHMLANIATQMDQAYQDNTMQPQENPVHIRNQSVCVSAMDVTRVPLMSQQAL